MTFIAPDGTWGTTKGLVLFNFERLSRELLEQIESDPKGAYEAIRKFGVELQ